MIILISDLLRNSCRKRSALELIGTRKPISQHTSRFRIRNGAMSFALCVQMISHNRSSLLANKMRNEACLLFVFVAFTASVQVNDLFMLSMLSWSRDSIVQHRSRWRIREYILVPKFATILQICNDDTSLRIINQTVNGVSCFVRGFSLRPRLFNC